MYGGRKTKTFVEDNLGVGIAWELSPIKTALNVARQTLSLLYPWAQVEMQSSAAWPFLPVTEQPPHLDRVLQKMKCLQKVVVSCNSGLVRIWEYIFGSLQSLRFKGRAGSLPLCFSRHVFLFLLLHHYKVIKIEPQLKRKEPKFRRRNILFPPIGPR